ncbi:MAG TPA: hypothetical protein VEQ63_15525 [Bryobacteraceae bacterium]|nr:hypothetical protein [Bryobacteraceae bacterium]
MTVVKANERLMASAERELGAFMRAVSELFGSEHAHRAGDDWLDEFERMDTLPETAHELGAITIAAAVRVATWINVDGGPRPPCLLDPAANLIAEPNPQFY